MRHPIMLAGTLLGTALLIAGCGGNKAANDSANTATVNAAEALTPGNDASAMETVGNAPAPATTLPPLSTANSSGTSDGDVPAQPADGGDTPPGGDTGGNSSEKEIPGM